MLVRLRGSSLEASPAGLGRQDVVSKKASIPSGLSSVQIAIDR